MDLSRVKTITIAHIDFLDLTNGRTNNPMAESELTEMLRQAIKSGVQVQLTDPFGKKSCRLELNDSGQFQYSSISQS